jgi:hypothetical protein
MPPVRPGSDVGWPAIRRVHIVAVAVSVRSINRWCAAPGNYVNFLARFVVATFNNALPLHDDGRWRWAFDDNSLTLTVDRTFVDGTF